MQANKPKISVTIIARNEAHAIRACLESVRFADEIIVLDSGSQDDTVKICREYTDKVFETDWPGYGSQHNRALQHASGEWILYIDADERVTSALKTEILTTLPLCGDTIAYNIPFHSYFCGQLIRFGDWYGEKHVRLFKRGCAKFNEKLVHEGLIITGKIADLQHHILHESYTSIEESIEKMNRYSTAGALVRQSQGKTSGLGKAIIKALAAFLRAYILRLGFLDGRAGFIVAVAGAEYSFYRYVKLMYLQKK